jgi:hypothetical protein
MGTFVSVGTTTGVNVAAGVAVQMMGVGVGSLPANCPPKNTNPHTPNAASATTPTSPPNIQTRAGMADKPGAPSPSPRPAAVRGLGTVSSIQLRSLIVISSRQCYAFTAAPSIKFTIGPR